MTRYERSVTPPAQCSFCRIIEGYDSAQVVYETPAVLAFFPLRPATIGHTLVIPKRHLDDFLALDQSFVEPFFSAVLLVSRSLQAALEPEGLNIISSSGTAASQTVFHLHVHVVPRWAHDRIGAIWPPPDSSTARVTADVVDRVRQACAKIT